MLAFILPIVLALVLACLALRYSKPGSSRLSERRHRMMVAVQIICGDCSGDAARAVRTFLDRSGARCEQCGGTSFTLASRLAASARQAMPRGAPASAFVFPTVRVVPFDAAAARRGSKSTKVA